MAPSRFRGGRTVRRRSLRSGRRDASVIPSAVGVRGTSNLSARRATVTVASWDSRRAASRRSARLALVGVRTALRWRTTRCSLTSSQSSRAERRGSSANRARCAIRARGRCVMAIHFFLPPEGHKSSAIMFFSPCRRSRSPGRRRAKGGAIMISCCQRPKAPGSLPGVPATSGRWASHAAGRRPARRSCVPPGLSCAYPCCSLYRYLLDQCPFHVRYLYRRACTTEGDSGDHL